MPQVNEPGCAVAFQAVRDVRKMHSPPRHAMKLVRERVAQLPHMSRVVTLAQLTASIVHEVNQTITASVINGKEMELRDLRAPAVAIPSLLEDRQVAAQLTERTASIWRCSYRAASYRPEARSTAVALLVECRGRHW